LIQLARRVATLDQTIAFHLQAMRVEPFDPIALGC